MTPPSSSLPTNIPGPHNITTATLANDVRVLVYENFSTEIVVIDGYMPGGSIAENPEQAGAANLMAAMLRRGTASRTFDEINETVESEGASFSFGSGRHVLSLDARALTEDVDLVLELLAESLIQPAFPPEQFEQIRARVLTSIQEREHNTRSKASLLFREHIYPQGHPYGRALSGYTETVQNLDVADLEAFYRRYVAPGGGVIVVVGAIRADDVIARLERTLGQWRQPAAEPVLSIPPRPELSGKREVTARIPGKSQSDVVLGWPGIERASDDYYAVLLCNNILGRFGMGGRLGYNVREKQGMAYYAYSTFSANRGAGTWYAAAGVNPENVDQTVATVRQEIDRITREPVDDEELADVQANLTGSLPLRLETNIGIASNLLNMAWYDLGLDYLMHYAGRIRAVDKADILRVARTYLDPERYILAVAGPDAPSD